MSKEKSREDGLSLLRILFLQTQNCYQKISQVEKTKGTGNTVYFAIDATVHCKKMRCEFML
jgi:hypothetical protein